MQLTSSNPLAAAVVAAPFALSLAGSGCASVVSTDIATDAMYADLVASSDGSSTHTTATLRVGDATSNTFVNLEGDDSLIVRSGEQSQTMTEAYLGDIYFYSADFDLFEGDTEFVFSLERSIDAGAPDNRVSLPQPIELTLPKSGETLSRETDDITVSWTPSGEPDLVRATVSGDCIWDEVVDADGDPGTLVIPAGSISPLDDNDPQSCDAVILLERRRAGTLDSALSQGGKIMGVQYSQQLIRTDI